LLPDFDSEFYYIQCFHLDIMFANFDMSLCRSFLPLCWLLPSFQARDFIFCDCPPLDQIFFIAKLISISSFSGIVVLSRVGYDETVDSDNSGFNIASDI